MRARHSKEGNAISVRNLHRLHDIVFGRDLNHNVVVGADAWGSAPDLQLCPVYSRR